MVKLVHKYVYSDRPYEKAKPSIVNGAMRINEGAAMNAASVKDQLEWFKSEKLVKDSITFETLVDRLLREDALGRTALCAEMELRLDKIGHAYMGMTVLDGIDLTIECGKIVCIVGPSGCGKSTLLRLIGGLEQPKTGAVLQIGDPPAVSLNPLTYIFQDFALLPWRSVEGNVSLVLEDHGIRRCGSRAYHC